MCERDREESDEKAVHDDVQHGRIDNLIYLRVLWIHSDFPPLHNPYVQQLNPVKHKTVTLEEQRPHVMIAHCIVEVCNILKRQQWEYLDPQEVIGKSE